MRSQAEGALRDGERDPRQAERASACRTSARVHGDALGLGMPRLPTAERCRARRGHGHFPEGTTRRPAGLSDTADQLRAAIAELDVGTASGGRAGRPRRVRPSKNLSKNWPIGCRVRQAETASQCPSRMSSAHPVSRVHPRHHSNALRATGRDSPETSPTHRRAPPPRTAAPQAPVPDAAVGPTPRFPDQNPHAIGSFTSANDTFVRFGTPDGARAPGPSVVMPSLVERPAEHHTLRGSDRQCTTRTGSPAASRLRTRTSLRLSHGRPGTSADHPRAPSTPETLGPAGVSIVTRRTPAAGEHERGQQRTPFPDTSAALPSALKRRIRRDVAAEPVHDQPVGTDAAVPVATSRRQVAAGRATRGPHRAPAVKSLRYACPLIDADRRPVGHPIPRRRPASASRSGGRARAGSVLNARRTPVCTARLPAAVQLDFNGKALRARCGHPPKNASSDWNSADGILAPARARPLCSRPTSATSDHRG